jgi:hypothetical protein
MFNKTLEIGCSVYRNTYGEQCKMSDRVEYNGQSKTSYRFHVEGGYFDEPEVYSWYNTFEHTTGAPPMIYELGYHKGNRYSFDATTQGSLCFVRRDINYLELKVIQHNPPHNCPCCKCPSQVCLETIHLDIGVWRTHPIDGTSKPVNISSAYIRSFNIQNFDEGYVLHIGAYAPPHYRVVLC